MKKNMIIVAGIVILLGVGGIAGHKVLENRNDGKSTEGYENLLKDEATSVASVEESINALHTPKPTTTVATQSAATDSGKQDSVKVQKKKAAKISIAKYKKMFEDSVVLGDSITESLNDYDCLYDSSMVYHRGWSVSGSESLFRTAISLHPKNIFLSFGTNDMQSCSGNAKLFIKNYKAKIKLLQKEIPDTKLYVNCILPVTQKAISQDPNLGNVDKFNKALQNMCEEMGFTYIDNAKFVLDDPGLYEPDGIHEIYRFYPMWMYNMAEVAGLL